MYNFCDRVQSRRRPALPEQRQEDGRRRVEWEADTCRRQVVGGRWQGLRRRFRSARWRTLWARGQSIPYGRPDIGTPRAPLTIGRYELNLNCLLV